MRGWLYKRAEKEKFFQTRTYYKRYFIVTSKQNFIQVQEFPVTKKYKRIEKNNILNIQKLSRAVTSEYSDMPWKFSFEIKTTERLYCLFAPTQEERDLWVNGINRLMGIPVKDSQFVPMGFVNKADLNLHDQVVMTEGNVVDQVIDDYQAAPKNPPT